METVTAILSQSSGLLSGHSDALFASVADPVKMINDGWSLTPPAPFFRPERSEVEKAINSGQWISTLL
jgi:hypothetical protein